jgi:diguanylate cyclase (GGDEF)-like protein
MLAPHVRAVLGFGALALMLALMLQLVADNRHAVRDRMARGRIYGHTLEVLLVTEQLRNEVVRAIQGERGFLLTHEQQFAQPLRQARAELPLLLGRLEQLTIDNPAQRAPIAELATNLSAYMAFMESEVVLEEVGDHRAAVERVLSGQGFHSVDDLMALIDVIAARENSLLTERRAALDRADARIDRSLRTLGWLGFLLIGVAFGAAVAAFRAFRQARVANRKLAVAVTTDALTGLNNRRAFFERLESSLAGKGGRPLALAMVDIDHFKSVNDRFGHPGGDEALRAVATALQGMVRTGDHVARIGGEEFAILIDGLDLADAGMVCEQVRARIAEVPIELGGEMLGVTLSLGVATRQPGESGDALVARADRALYEAKSNGRNRVRLAA